MAPLRILLGSLFKEKLEGPSNMERLNQERELTFEEAIGGRNSPELLADADRAASLEGRGSAGAPLGPAAQELEKRLTPGPNSGAEDAGVSERSLLAGDTSQADRGAKVVHTPFLRRLAEIKEPSDLVPDNTKKLFHLLRAGRHFL